MTSRLLALLLLAGALPVATARAQDDDPFGDVPDVAQVWWIPAIMCPGVKPTDTGPADATVSSSPTFSVLLTPSSRPS